MERRESVPQLEPLRFGEIIDAGFRLWRNHFKSLTGIVIALTLPVSVLLFLWQIAVVQSVSNSGLLLVEDREAYTAISSLVSLLQMLLYVIAVGAVFYLAGRAYVGEAPPLRTAAATAAKRVLPFIGMGILFFIPFIILVLIAGSAGIPGFVAFFVGSVLLAVSFSHAPNAFWEERKTAFESISRSFDLVRGRRWVVLGVLLVAVLVIFLFQIVFGFVVVFGLFGTNNVMLFLGTATIGSQLITAILLPIGPSMVTAAYYDARVRKEGFDMELAVRNLDDEPTDIGDDPWDHDPPIFR